MYEQEYYLMFLLPALLPDLIHQHVPHDFLCAIYQGGVGTCSPSFVAYPQFCLSAHKIRLISTSSTDSSRQNLNRHQNLLDSLLCCSSDMDQIYRFCLRADQGY
jgi:hypothetical protein